MGGIPMVLRLRPITCPLMAIKRTRSDPLPHFFQHGG